MISKKNEIIYQVFISILLAILGITTLYPFLNILAKSLSTGSAIVGEIVTIFPIKPTLLNYKVVFSDNSLLSAFIISMERTVSGSILHFIVTGLAAYALSKKGLKGRKFFLIFFLIPMYFGGGLIATYILISKLGLMNNFLVYILPGMFGVGSFLIMITFFKNLPPSMEESAKIDGASEFVVFTRIILPLSAPIVATIMLMSAVGQWNSWFDAILYVNKINLYPLQSLLQLIIIARQLDTLLLKASRGITHTEEVTFTIESVRAATMIVTILPIVFVYPFAQKYFVKGIMIGSIKG